MLLTPAPTVPAALPAGTWDPGVCVMDTHTPRTRLLRSHRHTTGHHMEPKHHTHNTRYLGHTNTHEHGTEASRTLTETGNPGVQDSRKRVHTHKEPRIWDTLAKTWNPGVLVSLPYKVPRTAGHTTQTERSWACTHLQPCTRKPGHWSPQIPHGCPRSGSSASGSCRDIMPQRAMGKC